MFVCWRNRWRLDGSSFQETMRLGNLAALNGFHRNSKATRIGGHFIAKDAHIMPQICCLLYDKKVGAFSDYGRRTRNTNIQIFPEPLKFKPERFIDENSGNLKQIAG